MKKSNKNKEKKRGISQISIIIIILTLMIGAIAFIYAQQNESLEQELNSLENELNNQGYSWLINYSVNYKNGGDIYGKTKNL